MTIDWTKSKWSPKCRDFLKTSIPDFKSIVILHGAVRSAKTVCIDIKFIEYMKWMENKAPIAVIGVTKDTVKDNMLNDIFDIVGKNNYSYNSQRGDLVFYDKYHCKVIGAKDKGSEKYLRGKTLAGAFVDELTQIPYDFFKQLINRCSIEGSKIFCSTNPDDPTHWVKKDFIDDETKKDIVQSYHFKLTDNWNLSAEYLMKLDASYTGVFHDRMVEGLWVVAEGLVFPEFNPKTHIITANNMRDNTYKEYIVGIDFGFSKPSCLTLWGVSVSNNFHLMKEYYQTQKTTSDLIKIIEEWNKELPKPISYIFPDPAEPDRALEMVQKNLKVVTTDNAIFSGLNCLKTNLKNGKIKVHRKCTNFINEITTLRWPMESEPGYGDEKKFIGEDHACDSARYAVYTYCKRILGLRY